MENVIISIIVPIYNGEKFIDRVVSSILPQINEKVELILVDDGSTDGSVTICDRYAGKYSHIQTVHKKNEGLSSARNAGIATAKGEYLSFVDVDDYIAGNAYSRLLDVIEEYRPDCIDFGWTYVGASGEQTENLHDIEKNKLLDRFTIEQLILPPLLNLCKDDAHFIYDFCWNKLFRADIVRKYQICFDEGRKTWEDRPFVVHYLKYCQTFYSLNQYLYFYVDVAGSLSRTYSLQFFDIILENYRMYKSWYGDCYNFEIQYVQNYWANAIENMIFRSLEETENKEQIQKNILNILADPQVVEWFSKRESANQFEKIVTEHILSGRCDIALNCFTKKYRINCIRKTFKNTVSKTKSTLRKLLK